MMKRCIMIGSLSGPNFAIRNAKRMDHSEFLSRNIDESCHVLTSSAAHLLEYRPMAKWNLFGLYKYRDIR